MAPRPQSTPAATPDQPKQGASQRSSFMARLHHAVSTSTGSDLLRFNDKGDGIIVSKDGPAVCNLLQKAGMDYKKFDTVVRQLNYWRFKRSEQTDGRKKRNRLEGSHQLFEHELVGHFRAGPTSLHNEVKRRQRAPKNKNQKANQASKAAVDTEMVDSPRYPSPAAVDSDAPPSPPLALDQSRVLEYNDEAHSTSKSPVSSPSFARPRSYPSTRSIHTARYSEEEALSPRDGSVDLSITCSPVQPLPPLLGSSDVLSPPLSTPIAFSPPRRARYLVQPVPLASPFAPPGTLNL